MWSYEVFWEYLLIDEPGFQRQKNIEMFDVSAWNICPISSPNVAWAISDKSKRALPTNWRSSTVWRDVYQLRSSVHGCLKSWVPKGQRDNRVDQVERVVVKSMLLRYFEPNSHSVCSYDNPLEWWYGGMVIWPKLNVPRCIALDFAVRQRMKTDERSDGFECVEWGSVMCWWRKSMMRGEKRTIYIYMYVCIYIYTYWSKLSVPFRRDSVFSLWETFGNSVMFTCLSCFKQKTWKLNIYIHFSFREIRLWKLPQATCDWS